MCCSLHTKVFVTFTQDATLQPSFKCMLNEIASLQYSFSSLKLFLWALAALSLVCMNSFREGFHFHLACAAQQSCHVQTQDFLNLPSVIISIWIPDWNNMKVRTMFIFWNYRYMFFWAFSSSSNMFWFLSFLFAIVNCTKANYNPYFLSLYYDFDKNVFHLGSSTLVLDNYCPAGLDVYLLQQRWIPLLNDLFSTPPHLAKAC